MTSSKPYIIRALYEWIIDNDHTPFLSVAATYPHTRVPEAYIKDGEIVLNISPTAIHGLEMTNEAVSFNARFSGQPFDLYIPVGAVLAIYDQETANGMVFSVDVDAPDSTSVSKDDDDTPSLSIVK